MDNPEETHRLPDPWLADSEWLLAELAKTREQILRIPYRLDNHSDVVAATDRIFNLERTLRHLLHLHREGQRAFARQHKEATKHPTKRQTKRASIVALRA